MRLFKWIASDVTWLCRGVSSNSAEREAMNKAIKRRRR
jgi:hypothetical protein